MHCLLEGRGPLLWKVYLPAGYLRILTSSPFSLFIDKQTDLLDSHSDPLPSSPLFIHVVPPWTPLICPSSWCSPQQSRVQLCSTACYRPYSCPMLFLLPFCGSCYPSRPLVIFDSSLLPSVESLTFWEYSSNVATRDARAVLQPGFQWLLVTGGTWQPPERGAQPGFVHRSCESHRSRSQDSVQNRLPWGLHHMHATSCTLLRAKSLSSS